MSFRGIDWESEFSHFTQEDTFSKDFRKSEVRSSISGQLLVSEFASKSQSLKKKMNKITNNCDKYGFTLKREEIHSKKIK